MDDGLPLSHANSVLASSDGYLWLTTYDGLVRFDGSTFRIFDASTTPELPTSRFVHLLEDDDGTLWFTAEFDHVVRLRDGRFTVYSLPPGARGGAIRALRFGEDGTGWVTTNRGVFRIGDVGLEWVEGTRKGVAGGVIHIDLRGVLYVGTDGRGALEIRPGVVEELWDGGDALDRLATSFAVGDRESLYIGTGSGVMRVRGESVTRLDFPITGDAYVTDLLPLAGDSILVVSRSGLLDLVDDALTTRNLAIASGSGESAFLATDPAGSRWLAVGRRLYRDESLVFEGSFPILGLTVDREGSVWVAADGLHRFKPSVFDVTGDAEGGVSNVYPVFEDSRGRIWVAGLGRGWGYFLDGRFHHVALDELSYLGQTIAEGPDGRIWVGQISYGGCVLDDLRCDPRSRFLSGRTVKALYRDRSGDMWVGTDRGAYRVVGDTWTRLTIADGLPHDFVRVFLQTSDGAVWMGTNGGGIARYRDGVIESLTAADGLSSDLVRALHETAPGIVWIGTEDGGLNRVSLADSAEPLATAEIRVVTRRTGLFDDGIHSIVDDGHGRLWMNTNRGIFWVLAEELERAADGGGVRVRSISYAESDGLANPEGNGGVQSAALRANDGRLWFAMQGGVAVVDPAAIEPSVEDVPVLIEELRAQSGDPLTIVRPPPDLIDLRPQQRDFQIDYTALSFTAPENLRFEYRLAGFQSGWVRADNRRSAFFTNVPPGRYRFAVRATGADGVWHEAEAPWTIRVRPFVYETTWFRGTMAASLVAIGLVGLRARDRRQRARESELESLVTERTATIEAQAARLEEVDRAKSRFFTNISHEFRTPLTLTIGPLEDLASGLHGALPREATASIDMSLRNSRRLLHLVNQLMDVAKLEAGALEVNARESDIVSFVALLLQAFEPHAERIGVSTGLDAPGHPIPVLFDAELLERVLMNLLSNAFKFTPEGGAVRVSIADTEDGWVSIAVRDSGRGIPADQLPHVFDRFYQGSSSSGTSQPGTGIGLSLAKELVSLHHGRLDVESEEGFGTTFTIRLRSGSEHVREAGGRHAAPPAGKLGGRVDDEMGLLDTRDPESLPEGEASHPGGEIGEEAADRPVVLIVEDNREVAAYIRQHLGDEFRCLEASDGVSALKITGEDLPDVVVSDVMMPGMDGLEMLRELRARPDTEYVPVLFLTARAGQDQRLEGLEAGAAAYMTKPFDVEELRLRVHGLIDQQRRLRERVRRESLLRPEVTAADTPADRFLLKLREAMLANLSDEDFDVRALARAMSESRSSLYRHVTELVGRTPSDLLRSTRLEQAAGMLEARMGSVQEIAYAVGFKSVSHFSRSFREQYGTPPSRYPTSE